MIKVVVMGMRIGRDGKPPLLSAVIAEARASCRQEAEVACVDQRARTCTAAATALDDLALAAGATSRVLAAAHTTPAVTNWQWPAPG